MKKLQLKIVLVMFLIAGNILSGCAVKVYDYKPSNTSSYKFSKNYAGLKVSVDPLFEEDRLIKYFGDDLLSYGILPVCINFENQNAEDGFIVIKEQSALMMKELNSKDRKDLGHDSEKNKEIDEIYKLPSAAEYWNVTTGAFLFGSVIGVFLSDAHYSNLLIKKQNLTDKQLIDKVVYPGSSQNGFIYFKINQKEHINSIGGLLLAAKNIRTNEIITIMIDMK